MRKKTTRRTTLRTTRTAEKKRRKNTKKTKKKKKKKDNEEYERIAHLNVGSRLKNDSSRERNPTELIVLFTSSPSSTRGTSHACTKRSYLECSWKTTERMRKYGNVCARNRRIRLV